MKTTLAFITLSTFVFLGACSDDKTTPQHDDGGQLTDTINNTSLVGFKTLGSYDGVAGSASIEVDVSGAPAKVELWANGVAVAEANSAPFTISWDSSAVADGVTKLQLKSYGANEQLAAQSEELPVVVINNGAAVPWFAPAEGSINIPADTAYLEEHLKYHWTMPAGVKKIVAVLFFDQPDFELELAVGVGECPDSGTTATSLASKSSPIELTFGDGANALGQGQWFAHVTITNPTDEAVKGKSANFTIKAYLLQ